MILANLLPPELTALRGAGLLAAAGIITYAVVRRRSLRNVDVLILLAAGIGLAIVAGTELTDRLLEAFSFQRGNGGRILGLAVFAIFVLFLMILRALSVSGRNSREMSAVLEGIAWEEFRQAGLPQRFRGRVGILIPAYNEAENIGYVLDRIPEEVCGVETAVLVVDDGSRDRTGDAATERGAAVARHLIRRVSLPSAAGSMLISSRSAGRRSPSRSAHSTTATPAACRSSKRPAATASSGSSSR